MKQLTSKRIKDGLYEYRFGAGLVFHVVKVNDGDTYADSQRWYFVNIDPHIDEGGDDLFSSKRDAVSALLEYVPRRTYMEPYGWVMGPENEQ